MTGKIDFNTLQEQAEQEYLRVYVPPTAPAPRPGWLLDLRDLLPTEEQLMDMAYFSVAGDPLTAPIGTHQGRNPDRKDTMGICKREVLMHARERKLAWFEPHALQLHANPFNLPPSLRTMIPKDEFNPAKGLRAIDDQAEIKRLILLHVRQLIEPRLVHRFTPGQLGGLNGKYIKTGLCKRRGATTQDQIATGIFIAIREGFPVCVLADLKDAFGLVPKKVAVSELMKCGLTKRAALWIWRLVRIDSLNARNRNHHYRRPGRGIEQGNQLSALIMNLVLAPVLRAAEKNHRVRVFTYLDDIYIMAATREEAAAAFKTFQSSANSRGFTNVRPLWQPGMPKDSKATRIINTNEQPVTVLKTYVIDQDGISLHPDKRTDLCRKEILTGKVSMKKLRRITGCHALTGKATRCRTPNLLRKPQQLPKEAPQGGDLNNLIASQEGEVTHTLHGGRDGHYDPSMENSFLSGKLEGEHTSFGDFEGDSKRHDLRSKEKKDHHLSLLYPNQDSHDVPGGRSDDLEGHQHQSDWPEGMPSHYHRDMGTLLPREEDSPTPARVTPGDRSQAGDADRPDLLSILSDELLVATLKGRRRQRAGDNYKGMVLDLRGLDQVVGEDAPARDYENAVNGLLRLVRQDNEVTVVYDPREPWTALQGLLGGQGDTTYKRVMQVVLEGGGIRVQLVRMRKKKWVRRRTELLPQVDVHVLGARCVDLALRDYDVSLVIGGVRQRVRVRVPQVANKATGCLMAVALVVQQHERASVAIRLKDSMAGLRWLAVLDRFKPGNVDYGDAVRALEKGRTWRYAESWLLTQNQPG